VDVDLCEKIKRKYRRDYGIKIYKKENSVKKIMEGKRSGVENEKRGEQR